MAIREIVKIGDPLLRKKSKEITEFNEKLSRLVDDMFETMYDAPGVGLAGVQIGMLRRIVVIDTGEPGEKLELINPVIKHTEGSQEFYEGCLSVPGKRGKTHRPTLVEVEAFNRKGEKQFIRGEGLLAVALCHEIDHLDGRMYVDIAEGELEDVD